jgi:hypothetical protein
VEEGLLGSYSMVEKYSSTVCDRSISLKRKNNKKNRYKSSRICGLFILYFFCKRKEKKELMTLDTDRLAYSEFASGSSKSSSSETLLTLE